jgi:hypothetical protein
MIDPEFFHSPALVDYGTRVGRGCVSPARRRVRRQQPGQRAHEQATTDAVVTAGRTPGSPSASRCHRWARARRSDVYRSLSAPGLLTSPFNLRIDSLDILNFDGFPVRGAQIVKSRWIPTYCCRSAILLWATRRFHPRRVCCQFDRRQARGEEPADAPVSPRRAHADAGPDRGYQRQAPRSVASRVPKASLSKKPAMAVANNS